MPFTRTACLLAIPLVVLAAGRAGAQELPEVQQIVSKVLFAQAAAADRRAVAETQRIEAIDRRAQAQVLMLQEQANSVRQLGGELQTLREERQVIDLAAAFDAALVSGRWEQARAFLATDVLVDLGGQAEPAPMPVAADALIAELSRSLPDGRVLPRSNQRVRIEGSRAVLESDGYAWGRITTPATRGQGAAPFGQYRYGLARTADGWRIDGLAFRPATPG